MYCIVLYCIVLYCIVLYCIVLYCIVLYCIDREITVSSLAKTGHDPYFPSNSLTFALRAGFPKKENLLVYRSHLVATVRRICALPTHASASYIFPHKRVGGLGLLDPTLEADIQAIIQAVKMLSSSDPTVINIANAEVNQTVRLAS